MIPSEEWIELFFSILGFLFTINTSLTNQMKYILWTKSVSDLRAIIFRIPVLDRNLNPSTAIRDLMP